MFELFTRTQTALTVRPSDDIAICGAVASFPAADRSAGVDQVAPLFELAVASIRVLVPSLRTQIAASRVPSAEDTTSGSEASWPAADRNVALVGLVHVESACEGLARTDKLAVVSTIAATAATTPRTRPVCLPPTSCPHLSLRTQVTTFEVGIPDEPLIPLGRVVIGLALQRTRKTTGCAAN